MKPFGLTILGATGSIGTNTLDVVARHKSNCWRSSAAALRPFLPWWRMMPLQTIYASV
jgi:hypothetical protein